ncbi:helix-turn-helix domain-containing protein, partial [Pedobacter agri]
YQLGFSDQSYFSRYFRKNTNMSPEQFRESTTRGAL